MELDQFFLSHSFKVCVQNFLVRIFVKAKAKQKEFGRTTREYFETWLTDCISSLIMIINKSILTTHQFPSFQALALGQMVSTVLLLFSAKYLGMIHF